MKIDRDLAELVEDAQQDLGRREWPATAYCEVKTDVSDHSKN